MQKRDLDGARATARRMQGSRTYRMFARVGHAATGDSIVVVGILFIWAARTLEPASAGGLDRALQAILVSPLGDVSLTVTAFGFVCYGISCFSWARYARFT